MPVTRTRRRQESTEIPKTQDPIKPVRRVRSHNDDVPVSKPTIVRVTRSQKKKLDETAQTAKQPVIVKRRKLQTDDSAVEPRASESALKDESAKKPTELQDDCKAKDSYEAASLTKPAENASASKSMSKVRKLHAIEKKALTPTLKDKTILEQEPAKGATDENIDVMKQHKEDQVKESSVTSVSSKSRKVLKEVAVSASNANDNTPEAHQKPEAYTKRKIICARTPSCNEKFDKRIEWKQKHYDQPVTSTPVLTGKTKRNMRKLPKFEMPAVNTTSEKDQSCPFDFEVNEAAQDFSMILSPIRKVKKPRKSNGTEVVVKMGIQEGKPVRFPDLLARYKDDNEDPDELHVNPEAVKITYCNNKPKYVPKPIVFHEPLVPIKDSLPVKRPRLTKKLTKKEKPLWEKVDKQMEKWLEQTQKEFSDVEQTPLVVERSP